MAFSIQPPGLGLPGCQLPRKLLYSKPSSYQSLAWSKARTIHVCTDAARRAARGAGHGHRRRGILTQLTARARCQEESANRSGRTRETRLTEHARSMLAQASLLRPNVRSCADGRRGLAFVRARLETLPEQSTPTNQ